MTVRTSTLTAEGQASIKLEMRSGVLGKTAVDIRPLGEHGLCSYDPGFANTAGCESAITYIDAVNSVLLHRGFPVEQLAEQCDFTEVCYILLHGEAPSAEAYAKFADNITRHTLVHEQISRMFSGFRRDSHPMALMCAVVGALAAFYHDVLISIMRSIASWRRYGCCRKCRRWRRCATNIPLSSRPSIRVILSPIPATSCTCCFRFRRKNMK